MQVSDYISFVGNLKKSDLKHQLSQCKDNKFFSYEIYMLWTEFVTMILDGYFDIDVKKKKGREKCVP